MSLTAASLCRIRHCCRLRYCHMCCTHATMLEIVASSQSIPLDALQRELGYLGYSVWLQPPCCWPCPWRLQLRMCFTTAVLCGAVTIAIGHAIGGDHMCALDSAAGSELDCRRSKAAAITLSAVCIAADFSNPMCRELLQPSIIASLQPLIIAR